MSRLNEFYKNEVKDALMKKFNYSSPMQIPKLDKVVVNLPLTPLIKPCFSLG